MLPATARLPLAPEALARAPRARVRPPFLREASDIVAVEDCGGGFQRRMHPWFGIMLVRSPAVVSVESRRDVVADRNQVVLIPPFRLHGLRALGEAAEGAVTLLVRGLLLEGLGLPAEVALVTDRGLGKKVAALVSQLKRPIRPVEQSTTIRPLLEQLLACSTSFAAPRGRRTNSMDPLRRFLQAHVSDAISTKDLAGMKGLTESHLIRTFHYQFGLPPHAYHLRLRLAAACEMLAGGVAVAGVAYECGFADQSHLSRKFKAVYGVTPAAWAAGSTGRNRYDAGMFSADTAHLPPLGIRSASARWC